MFTSDTIVDDFALVEFTMKAKEMEIAFVIDTTGSMEPYIKAAKDTVLALANQLDKKCGTTIKFGAVAYRDHPQDRAPTYITKLKDFTSDPQDFKAFINGESAAGGDDHPEALNTALKVAADKISWSDDNETIRILVVITDAPPHGIGESGDFFPQGDPDGSCGIEAARRMAKKGITIHTVAVEPSISTMSKFGKDFLCAVAKTTQGRCVRLDESKQLIDLVCGTVTEASELDDLMALPTGDGDAPSMGSIAQQVEALTIGGMPEDEAVNAVYRSLSSQLETMGRKVTQVECSEVEESKAAKVFLEAPSLEEARKKLVKIAPTIPEGFPMPDGRSFGCPDIGESKYRSLGAPREPSSRSSDPAGVRDYRSLATADPDPPCKRPCLAPTRPTAKPGALTRAQFDRMLCRSRSAMAL